MNKKLTEYNFPEALKSMDEAELELLSYAIREFLISTVSCTGGHLASNLGVVELTLGLHKVFDSPKDKIIWDVGHQSYVHKILTGRAKDFDHLRQYGGISGFPKAAESEHDVYDTGHSSTSISAAAGMAAARDLKHEDYNIIAVIGDGSMTGGMAFEALNNIGAGKSKVIVILNDNGMSISRNIGGLSNHLMGLRSSLRYKDAKKTVRDSLNRIPVVGKELTTGISNTKERIKYAILSEGIIFEELGFTYLGPIDGHKMTDVLEGLESAKKVEGPVILHVITKKGKGYRNAETHPHKFHGIGPFDVETGAPRKSSGTTWSGVMGETLADLGQKDSGIVAITAAMEDATGLSAFKEACPGRCFDVGIAEAHAVTFAAGLAKGGMHPLVAIYSSFLQRAYDQILEDVCLQNLPVVFAIDRAGIVGADGETHHGLMDITYLLSMPNMELLAPSDGDQLAAMLRYAFTKKNPVAIRYPRGGCTVHEKKDSKSLKPFPYHGGNTRLCSGTDGDLWAVGSMIRQGEEALEELKSRGLNFGLVAVNQVKPCDLTLLSEDSTKPIVTVEDGKVLGGFGQYLRGQLNDNSRVLNLGWPDQFIEHGTTDQLYHAYGLDGPGIAERICDYLEGKA